MFVLYMTQMSIQLIKDHHNQQVINFYINLIDLEVEKIIEYDKEGKKIQVSYYKPFVNLDQFWIKDKDHIPLNDTINPDQEFLV